jgi:hypothetical protein
MESRKPFKSPVTPTSERERELFIKEIQAGVPFVSGMVAFPSAGPNSLAMAPSKKASRCSIIQDFSLVTPTNIVNCVRAAFKEWAIVVDALGRGEQILILRKGGIAEGRGGFQVQHPRFWLFPTLFHQQRQQVVPSAQARFDEIASGLPKPDRLHIQFAANLVAWHRLETLEAADALRGQHIWRDEVIAERFEWGRSKDIFAMAVRVARLAKAVELPMLPGYGGCKSWIELEEDVDASNATPVLSDEEFAAKLERFKAAMLARGI